MEPPSSELVRTLRELKLCGPGELRQAARIIHGLAQDLPTFDSVWIDALVQLRCLTHFQGERLTDVDASSLLVGGHVLLNHFGRDSWYHHYGAIATDAQARRRLTCMDVRGLNAPAVLERLTTTVSKLKRVDRRHLHIPVGAIVEGERAIVIAELDEDRDLKELMIRRGRWRPELVRALAAQITAGLSALERAGLCHGDVRLETVTLSRQGTCRLRLPGILPAVHPELTIHVDFTPECTECLAPERVGVGSTATPSSDQYSLGCLMWHLLTGRPPYLSADPLTKLAQHRTRSLADVRELAPDTPDDLWHIIVRLTERDPSQRFASWTEALSKMGHSTHAGQRRLATFSRSLERPILTARDWGQLLHSGKRMTRVAAVVGLIALAVFWFPANRGLLLNIAGSLTDGSASSSDADDVAAADSQTGQPDATQSPPYDMPAPNADGIVVLDGPGPWRARAYEADGTLIVRGTSAEVPVIEIDGTALSLTGEIARIENVILRHSETQHPGPLVEVAAGELHIERCVLWDRNPTPPLLPLVQVTSDQQATGLRQLRCIDSFLISQGSAFLLEQGADDVEFQQTLRLGSGPLLKVEQLPVDGMQVQLTQVTVRHSGPICQLPAGPCRIRLNVDESILELDSSRAWLEFTGVGAPGEWPAAIEIAGQGTIASPAAFVGTRINSEHPLTSVDESELLIDGWFEGEFVFRATASLSVGDSMLSSWTSDAPRQSTTDPGIDAGRLIDLSEDHVRTGALE